MERNPEVMDIQIAKYEIFPVLRALDHAIAKGDFGRDEVEPMKWFRDRLFEQLLQNYDSHPA